MNDIKLHYFQKDLLKKLTLSDKPRRFNDLLIEGLESEHMNYHLQRLIDHGYVRKSTDGYQLTDTGKDYSNLMDDALEEVEKQPKTSVLILACRKREGTNTDEFLMSRRLRHPYYGKVGLLTGKVRFEETIEQAVQRELYEETGLNGKTVTLLNIYHKIRKKGDSIVQNNIFYRHLVTDISGELIKRTEHQENFWATIDELNSRDDLFDSFNTKWLTRTIPPLTYTVDIAEAEGY
jgi:8-oxo-dGTP pyrophosphatase MutT (NUDIX family)